MENEAVNVRVSQPTPVNQKSLNAYLMGILNGLRDGEINPNQGIAIAKVASQINMTYNLSLKRTMVEAMLEKMGKSIDAKMYNLDSKAIE